MNRHLAGLDAMRGVAALIVLALHVTTFADGMAARAPAHGYLAVDFFFMPSGFVLAHAYAARLAAGMSPVRLLRARAIRLFPMIALGTAIGMAGAAVRHAPPVAILLAGGFGLTTLPMPPMPAVGPSLWPADPPLWSLHWEVMASLLFAAGLWRLPSRMLAAAIGTAGCGIAWAVLSHGSLDLGYAPEHLFGGPLRVAYAFAAGLLMQRIAAAGRLPRIAVPLPLTALALVACCVGPARPIAGYDAIVVLAVLPLLLAAVIHAPADHAAWRIGAALSYPLYLTHLPIIMLADHLGLMGAASRPAGMALTALACLAVAAAALLGWDVPIRRRLGGQSSRLRGSSTASPSTSRNQWRVTAVIGRPS